MGNHQSRTKDPTAAKGTYKLTAPVRKRLLDAFRTGASHRAAARACGVHYGTLERWIAVAREDRRLGRDTPLSQLLDEVESARAQAIETLDAIEWQIANDPKATEGARLRACETIRARLEAKGPTPIRVEVSGQVEHQHAGAVAHVHTEARPVTDTQLRAASAEEIERLIAALGQAGVAPVEVDA